MHIIDEAVARRAIHLALPTIACAMTDPAAGDSGCLHIVVMDPLAAPSGMQPWFDEALAGVVACCLRASAKARAVEAARAGPFLPMH